MTTNHSDLLSRQALERTQDAMSYRRFSASYADATQEQRDLINRVIDAPVKSTDGVVLVHNETRVFTNNLDRGVVDLSRLHFDWHPGQNRWVPWFDVNCDIDYKGNTINRTYDQSDDRVAYEFNGRKA